MIRFATQCVTRSGLDTASGAEGGSKSGNAQKSTGARSARGRTALRYNAVKHGFFAKQVVLSSQAIGEDPEEFEHLLKKLRQHYQPADAGEELQVEIIAVCLWRERRALRCELGEIGYARAEHTRFGLPSYSLELKNAYASTKAIIHPPSHPSFP